DRLGAHRIATSHDLWARLLCGRNDAVRRAALRPRQAWDGASRLAAPVRSDDRGGNADQQDGAGAAQGLRSDAGAPLRHLDGLLRQRRRLLYPAQVTTRKFFGSMTRKL